MIAMNSVSVEYRIFWVNSGNQGLSLGWNFKDPNYNGCGRDIYECV